MYIIEVGLRGIQLSRRKVYVSRFRPRDILLRKGHGFAPVSMGGVRRLPFLPHSLLFSSLPVSPKDCHHKIDCYSSKV